VAEHTTSAASTRLHGKADRSVHGGQTGEVIRSAVAAFNAGDQTALESSDTIGVAAGVYPQELLGCSPSRVRRFSRPLPLVAGQDEVSLTSISLLADGRAVCMLTAGDLQIVAIYAVADGKIVAGCHYFSDVDMLINIGTLPSRATAQRAPNPRASTQDVWASETLRDTLRERRLAHRQERLRLVIHALDERLAALAASRRAVPSALVAAIHGFQHELASVRTEIHVLRHAHENEPLEHKRPENDRGEP